MSDIQINQTPQQVNETTQREADQKMVSVQVTGISKPDASVILNNLPPSLQPLGLDKFSILLNKKGTSIQSILIPAIMDLFSKAGFKIIGSKIHLPDQCLHPIEMHKLINTRNQIVDKLNNISNTINLFNKTLTGINTLAGTLKQALSTIKTARTVGITSTQFIPSPPGTPGVSVSFLANSKDLIDSLTPLYNKATGNIASMTLSVSVLNDILLKIISLLKSLDSYIQKCNPSNSSLISLDNSLIQLEQINTQTQQSNNYSYNGFILEIIEEPYSPTVNRRKAVAKNSQGIILLSTPLSFTTLDDVLIQEIKLLIDSNNLKAD